MHLHALFNRPVLRVEIDFVNLPYFKLYPGDWQKDPTFKLCSHLEKGVLFDALLIAAETDERGVFIVGGSTWNERQLADAVGGNKDVTLKSISDLLQKGVLQRRLDGAIFVGFLVKQEEVRKKRAAGGRFGGNPSLCKVNLNGNHTPHLVREHEHESVPSASGKREGEGETRLKVPDSLKTPRFEATWNAWVDHRIAIGRCKDFPVMFQKQLDWLGDYPEQIAVQMLDQSLRNNWQGIFEIKHNTHAPSTNGNGHTHSIYELQSIIKAKDNQRKEIKSRYCSEVALGDTWSSDDKRKQYFQIGKEIKTLNEKIARLQ